MSISEEDRKELHQLLDNMLNEKERVGLLSKCDWDNVDLVRRFRLKIEYDEQRYSNGQLRVSSGT